MKKYFKFFLYITIFFVGFLGYGTAKRVQAAQCTVKIVFDVKPNPAAFNQSITLSGTVDLRGSVFNPPGTTGAGYCSDDSGAAVKELLIKFIGVYNAINPITLTVPTTVNRLLSFSANMVPSGKGLKSGDNMSISVEVWPKNNTGSVLINSGTVNVRLTQGVYQGYACVADNQFYACSPGNLPDCSDTAACKGKACSVITDTRLCGERGTIFACVANNGKYACSPGDLPSLNDVPNNACQGRTAIRIDKRLCGQSVPTSPPGAQPQNPTPGTQPQNPTPGAQPGIDSKLDELLFNPLPTDNLTGTLLTIAKGFLGIVALWAVVFIIIGGFKLTMAQGQEEAYLAAKKTITWAILGLVVAMLSFSIIAIVQNLLQVKVPPPPSGEEQAVKIPTPQ